MTFSRQYLSCKQMKNLIIIGARGFGREVYCLASDCIAAGLNLEIKGFLDDKADALDGFANYPPILSAVEDYQIFEDDVFVCALGDVHYKKHYSEIVLNKGGNFISLIHPTVSISNNTKIGAGCILLHNLMVSCDVVIEDFVTIQSFSAIGHDAKISKWSHLGLYSFLGGYSLVEQGATIHPGAKIIPGKIIKQWSTVGVGSIVIKNVPENTTVFGNPAKILKT